MAEAAEVINEAVEPVVTNPVVEPATDPVEPVVEAKEATSVLDADDKPVVSTFPDDWRTVMAGDDEKALKLLDRYASPQAAAKALVDFRQKMSAGDLAKPLGDSPTDEELADYRSNLGIPANAEDYETSVDGVVFGEEDQPIIGEFLKSAHGANFTPKQVEATMRWYNDFKEQELSSQAESDSAAAREAIDDLRQEYGADYRRNMNVLEGHLTTMFGDGAEDIKGARMPDGTPLLANANMVRAFVNAAIEMNPLATVVPGAGSNQASAIDDELAQIKSKMGTNEYIKNPAMKARYAELLEAKLKI